MSNCKAGLDKPSNAPDKAISAYAKTMGDYVTKLGQIVEKMKALGSYDSLEYGTSQYSQYQDLQDELYQIDSAYTAFRFAKGLDEGKRGLRPQ